MLVKICGRCKEEKSVSEFSKSYRNRDGLYWACRDCDAQIQLSSRNKLVLENDVWIKRSDTLEFKENKNKAKKRYMSTEYGQKQEIKRHRIYYENNKEKRETVEYREKHNERSRNYRKKNPQKWSETQTKCRKKRRILKGDEIRLKKREYDKKRKEKIPYIKLIASAGTRIRRVLKSQNITKKNTTLDLLGCSADYFQYYITSQFKDGMSLQNHGKGEGSWHLDHIIPCVLFDLNDIEQQKICFNWCNYQPLWEAENLSKNSFWEGKRYGFQLSK